MASLPAKPLATTATTTTTATTACNYTNKHGVRCGLKTGHTGDHELDEQLVEPDPFCIRATDPFALAAIRLWISSAWAHKINLAKIQRAEEHYREIARWQRSNGTRLPD